MDLLFHFFISIERETIMIMFRKYVIASSNSPVPYDLVMFSETLIVRKSGLKVKIIYGTIRAIVIETISRMEYLINNFVITNMCFMFMQI